MPSRGKEVNIVTQDLLVLHLPKLKFVVLEFDTELTCEFRVFALFNFDANNPVIKRLLKKIYQYIQEQ